MTPVGKPYVNGLEVLVMNHAYMFTGCDYGVLSSLVLGATMGSAKEKKLVIELGPVDNRDFMNGIV